MKAIKFIALLEQLLMSHDIRSFEQLRGPYVQSDFNLSRIGLTILSSIKMDRVAILLLYILFCQETEKKWVVFSVLPGVS